MTIFYLDDPQGPGPDWMREDPVTASASIQVFHLQGQHDQQSHAGREGRMGPKVLNDDPDRYGDWSDLDLTDQKAVRAAAESFAEQLTAERDDDIDFRVRWAIVNDDSTTVSIDAYSPDTQVAAMTRVLDHDRGTMRAASLSVDDQFQGQGVGTQMREGFEDFAASVGMQEAMVGATDVGAYAWTRAGYDWLPYTNMADMADAVRADAPELADRFAAAAAAEPRGTIADIAPTPWETAEVLGPEGMMRNIPTWAGRKRLRTRSLTASAAESRETRVDRIIEAYAQWWPRFPEAADGADDPAAEAAWDRLVGQAD